MSTVPNPHEPETILAHITPTSPQPRADPEADFTWPVKHARNIYADALAVQDASNLSGVVKSLATALDTIWIEAREFGEGTEYVNTHPVVKLYLSKLMSLAGYYDNIEDYGEAARMCEAKAQP